MRYVKILPVLALLFLTVAGCSSLHSEIRPGFDWAAVSDVVLHAPPQDPWQLVPLVQQELQGLHHVLQPPAFRNPDLIVRFSWQEGPDFTSDGVLVTRPKSLHLQFVDPRDDALVAVADYFLRSSEEPAAGIKAAFAGLRRDILAGSVMPSAPVQIQPSAEQAGNPAAKTEEAIPRVEQAAAPSPAPVAVPVATPVAAPARVVPEQGKPAEPAMPAPVVESSQPASPRAEVSETSKVESQTPALKPMERSPWLPKFKSWGFEEWGKTGDSE